MVDLVAALPVEALPVEVRVVDLVVAQRVDLEPGLVLAPEWERVLAWHNRPESSQPPV